MVQLPEKTSGRMYVEKFEDSLLSSGTSKLTVKNYSADVKRFINWFEEKFQKGFEPSGVTGTTLSTYRSEKLSSYSASSIDRNLSSLRKFFTYLKLDGHIQSSPLQKEAVKPASDPWRLKDFKNYLYVYNSSHLTIKNYIIDVRQFLSWAEEVTRSSEDWLSDKRSIYEKNHA